MLLKCYRGVIMAYYPRLKDLREDKDKTQKEIAEALQKNGIENYVISEGGKLCTCRLKLLLFLYLR